MNQIFQFNNKFYQQTGTAIGNPLSYFIANLFIRNFKIKSQKHDHILPNLDILHISVC